jgi:hypothetical protein
LRERRGKGVRKGGEKWDKEERGETLGQSNHKLYLYNFFDKPRDRL